LWSLGHRDKPYEDERKRMGGQKASLFLRRRWRSSFSRRCFAEEDVTIFAGEQNIAPGIVFGQLQKKGVIGFNKLNHLKETIELPE